MKLAYKALTGVSEAFTRALDVVLPRWVPMYVIRLVVACGWGAFALASATRLISRGRRRGRRLVSLRGAGERRGRRRTRTRGGDIRVRHRFERARASTTGGFRRETTRGGSRAEERESARNRRRRRTYGDYGDDERVAYVGDDADDAYDDARAPTFDFDARAFERGAEAFNETFGNSSEGARGVQAARDVTVEVRQFGDEALREFKRAFSLNGGDFDFDGDDVEGDDGDDGVVAVEFRRPRETKTAGPPSYKSSMSTR